MDNCTVRIVTAVEGERSVFSVSGFLTRTENGVRVLYRDEGDEVTLACAKEIVMERRGKVCLSARFAAGERTELVTVLDGVRGSVPIVTTQLQTKEFQNRFTVLLGYELIFEQNYTHYFLEISIRSSEGS